MPPSTEAPHVITDKVYTMLTTFVEDIDLCQYAIGGARGSIP